MVFDFLLWVIFILVIVGVVVVQVCVVIEGAGIDIGKRGDDARRSGERRVEW